MVTWCFFNNIDLLCRKIVFIILLYIDIGYCKRSHIRSSEVKYTIYKYYAIIKLQKDVM